MPRPKTPHRPLRVEPLENRALLAITPLIDEATPVRALVPTEQQYNDFGLEWTEVGFSDSAWLASNNTAPNGVGYGNPPGTTYLQFIDAATNVGAAMSGISPTAFVRIPFTVADPAAFNRVVLKLRYDDAFIAYINGTEVARSQSAPVGYPPRDALATGPHDQVVQLGAAYAGYNLGTLSGVLQAGTNVLAIRGFNVSLSDDDFLIQATLEGQTPGAPPVAANDSLRFTKGSATQAERTVNVLLNDAAGENPLSSAPIRIISGPASGTLNINQSTGAVEYIPSSPNIAGTDNFVYQIEDATGSVGDFLTLVNHATPVRAYVPTDASLGETWQQPNFDDSTWIAGTGYVGYDTNGATGGDFNPFVGPGTSGANVAGMRAVNASAYARYEFTLDAATLPSIDTFTMRMRLDDGFVAYLNGVQFASRNAPATISHTSNATANRTGNEGLTPITINDLLTAEAKGALRAGENALAVQMLNVNAGDVDALLQAELTARTTIAGGVSNPAVVTIQVESLEPTAVDDGSINEPISVARDVPRAIEVLLNDIPGTEPDAGDPPIDPESIQVTSQPVNGTVVANPNGTITYTPASGFLGADTFQYIVRDSSQAAAITVPLRLIRASTSTLGPPAMVGAPGDLWRFNDSGSNLGTSWRSPSFDDSTWKEGPSHFGYGDGDENTLVDCSSAEGEDCGAGQQSSHYITTYFRRTFEIENIANVTAARLRFIRDDGIVVYINGVEWTRSNMPSGTINSSTPASGITEDTLLAYSATSTQLAQLVTGTNTIAVELHQYSTTSLDLSFDLQLDVDERHMVGRASNSAEVTIEIVLGEPTASDDAVVTRQANPVAINLIENDSPFPGGAPLDVGSVVITDPPSHGSVVIDPQGNAVYSPEPDFVGLDNFAYQIRDIRLTPIMIDTSVIPSGSVWRYLDDGSDQGIAWRDAEFDKSAWKFGPAELGYGDGDEATIVKFGLDAADKPITTYFRNRFHVSDPTKITAGRLRLRFDDGIVVYVNGHEIERRNMPADEIHFDTPASTIVSGDAVNFQIVPLTAEEIALLIAGENTISVEIHQSSSTSSDISFDLELQTTVAEFQGVVSNEADVTVEVQPASGGPVALNDSAITAEDSFVEIEVLANDEMGSGGLPIDPTTVWIFQEPAHGSISVDSVTGKVRYVPATDFAGTDSFQYVVFDRALTPADRNVSAPATVSVAITGADDAPAVGDDLYLAEEDDELIIDAMFGVLANDREPDGDPLAIRLMTPPAHGSVVLDGQGGFRYRATANFIGDDEFIYVVSDGQSDSAPATVTIRVTGVNDRPVPANDTFAISQPPVGAVTLIPAGSVWRFLDNGTHPPVEWRQLSFDDSQWKQGPAQLGYGDGDEATLVNFGDDVNQRHITTYFRTKFDVQDPSEFVALVLELLRDDGAAMYINNLSSLGSNLTSSPDPGELAASAVNGEDESRFFPITASPGWLHSGTNIAAVEVHQVNSTSNDLSFDLKLTGVLASQPTGNLLINDSDVDGDALTTSLASQPRFGLATVRPDGTFYYAPYSTFSGVDSFTYRVSDGRASVVATVTITVQPRTPCTVADLNADGQITLADLARLVENYGASPEPFEDGDLDGDGYVGVADLPLLRNLLGQSCAQAPAAAVVIHSATNDTPPANEPLRAVRRDRAADRVFARAPSHLPSATSLSATRHDATTVDAALAEPASWSRRQRLRPAIRRTPGLP